MNFSINIPDDIVKKIDKERGDIPRSRFVTRLLEKFYGGDHKY